MKDSLFLMAQPSFLNGVSTVLDLGDTLTVFNTSESGEAADHIALWADWELIADDLKSAAQKYSREFDGVETQSTR
jgi:hypothetical protein